MVRAWYFKASEADQREPHMPDPPAFLDLQQLYQTTGVEYFSFDADSIETNAEYSALKASRGYTYEDTVNIAKDTIPNYEDKMKNFFTEHIHADEEIRFVEAGSGYFDVRDRDDNWVRVEITKNDLLVLPAGIYHRFTLDTRNHIKVKRLFVGDPVWTPINRPADDHPKRQAYVETDFAAKEM